MLVVAEAVRTAARVEWEEVDAVAATAGLRCLAEVMVAEEVGPAEEVAPAEEVGPAPRRDPVGAEPVGWLRIGT